MSLLYSPAYAQDGGLPAETQKMIKETETHAAVGRLRLSRDAGALQRCQDVASDQTHWIHKGPACHEVQRP